MDDTRALPTVKELSNALSSVTAKWHTLGVKLGLESCDLDTIQQNYPRDSSRCRDEMLACCRQSTTPLTWKMTVDALHQMGEHRLANRIRTEHPSSFTATREQPSPPHLQGVQAQPHSLKEEIKQFEEKYEDLVDDVLSAFKTGEVSIKKILKCLRQLPVSLKLQCGEFLQSQAAHLSRASSIDELFFILSPHWDFLNPSLLAHLAYRFGDDETIRAVDEYMGELREFRKRTKINDFIDIWTGILQPDTQQIVMELGDNWREQSLEQLEELRIEVSHKCWFEGYVMPLKRIKVSSVDAVFSLPDSIDIHSLELESLRQFFLEHQILRILLNGTCIFDLQLHQDGYTALMIASYEGNFSVVRKLLQAGATAKRDDALYLAACYGHEDIVELLLAAKADPNVKHQKSRETAIMVAARNGNMGIVRKLIKQGAIVNLTNKDGYNALYIAVQKKHEDIVELLCEAIADPEPREKARALHFAASNGHEDVVELLLGAKADPELVLKQSQETVLMVAARKGRLEIVRRLIEHGARVNRTNKDERAALYIAAEQGHANVAELLLEAEADPEVKEKGGTTALMIASSKGHSSVVRKLLQAGATINTTNNWGGTALYVAARCKHEDVIELLLEAKANPDQQIENGNTALIIASSKGHTSVVRKLLQAGATVNIANKTGCTALNTAATQGHKDVVQLLLEARADPDLQGKDGNTALMNASSNGHSSVVEMLLLGGATVNTTNKDGNTALMIASSNGHSSVVEMLLLGGATVNTTNKDGDTALMIASSSGHSSVVEMLLPAGATVNATNEDGDTALIIASSNGHSSVVEVLLPAGATVNTINEDGDTALIIASSNGRSSVVEMLLKAGATINTTNELGDTALTTASYYDNYSVVRKLLLGGAIVNTITKDGRTALYFAACNGCEDVVELLLEANANPDWKYTEEQETTLMVAAWKGSVGITRRLIQHGASVNLTNQAGQTALDIAILYGNTEVCEELLKHT